MQKEEKIVLAFAIAFSCFQGLIFPIFSMTIGEMSASFSLESNTDEVITSLLSRFWIMLLLACTIIITSFFSAVSWNQLSFKQCDYLKKVYFSALLRQDVSFFDKQKTDELSTTFVSNVKNFSYLFSQRMSFYFMIYAQVFAGVLVGMIRSVVFTLIVIFIIPILIIFMYFSIKSQQKMQAAKNKRSGNISALFAQSLRLIRVIKSLCGEEHECNKFNKISENDRIKSGKEGFGQGLGWGLFLFGVLSMFTTMFLIGRLLVIYEVINFNTGNPHSKVDIISVIFSMLPGMLSFANLNSLEQNLQTGKKTISLIAKLDKSGKENEHLNFSNPDLDFKNSTIKFENVSFAYPSNPNKVVLENISFEVKAGNKVALVGTSGSGKSTVVQLLQGFYKPTKGRILVDHFDISSIDKTIIRQKFGVVSQVPVLFSMTIRENLTMGIDITEELSDDKLFDNLKKIGADKMISNFQEGLDHFLINGGSELSKGEKQRLAIARCLCTSPDILIFDESTSAFDLKEETQFYNKLDRIAQGRTNFHVAHKIKSLHEADLVLVFHNGKLIEKGSGNELLNNTDSRFRELYDLQNFDKNSEDITQLDIESQDTNENDKTTKIAINEVSSSNSIIGSLQSLPFINYFTASSETQILFSSSLKQFLVFLKKNPTNSIIYILGTIYLGSLTPILGVFMSKFIFYFEDKNTSNYFIYLYLSYILALFCIPISYFRQGNGVRISSEIIHFLRTSLQKSLVNTKIPFFDKPQYHPGMLSLYMIEDTKVIYETISQNLQIFLQAIFAFTSAVIFGFSVAWTATLPSILAYVLLMFYKISESKFVNSYSFKNGQVKEVLLSESLINIKLVFTLNARIRLEQLFVQSIIKTTWEKWGLPLLAGLVFGFSQLLNYITYGVLLVAGSVFAKSQGISMEESIAALFCILFSFNGILIINEQLSAIVEAKKSYSRIRNIINQAEPEYKKQEIKSIYSEKESIDLTSTISKPKSIEFKNVCFSFDSGTPIFKGVNFKIQAGDIVGLFGPSAVGKSTIISLILRFYQPKKGKILIGGIDIEKIPLEELRKEFGVLWQFNAIFDGSIEYNIAYDESITQSDLKKALVDSNVMEFIEREPEGVSREIGYGGDKISGGQRQRLMISRLLSKNSSMYLIDEPISALDASNENLLRNTLLSQTKNKTRLL